MGFVESKNPLTVQAAEETGSPRLIDFMRGALASNALQSGDYHRALPLVEAIIARGADPNLSYRYNQLAGALLGLNRNEEAVVAAEKAVELAKDRRDVLPGFLWRLAEAHRSLGRKAEALANLQRALEILEEQRARLIPTDFMRRGFSEQYQYAYAQTIALQYEQGDAAQALETAERARSRAFLDLLATRDVQLRQADTAALKELQAGSSEVRNRASEAAPTAEPVLTMRGVPTEPPARRPASQPDLPSFVTAGSLSFAQMQQTAGHLRSTMLSYWVAEKELYVWVVPPQGPVRAERVAITSARLTELVRAAAGMGGSPDNRERIPMLGGAAATKAPHCEPHSFACCATCAMARSR